MRDGAARSVPPGVDLPPGSGILGLRVQGLEHLLSWVSSSLGWAAIFGVVPVGFGNLGPCGGLRVKLEACDCKYSSVPDVVRRPGVCNVSWAA